MPPVIFAPSALRDLERLREFLRSKNTAAAKRTAIVIIKAVQILAQHPQMGKPSDELDADYRELPIAFGDSGYVVLYRCEGDAVIVVAVRHQKEVGF